MVYQQHYFDVYDLGVVLYWYPDRVQLAVYAHLFFRSLRTGFLQGANSHFQRPAGPHFPARQGHIKRPVLESGTVVQGRDGLHPADQY